MIKILKNAVRILVFSPYAARCLVKPALKLHNITYSLSGMYANILNNGVHPKLGIIKYHNWFLDHIQKDWNLLDIGANTGSLSYHLSQKAKQVYAIEMVKKLVKTARKTNSNQNIEYINADATLFDYSALGKIDAVVLSNVLEHIEDRVGFLNQIIERVHWAGDIRFLIRVPCLERDWITLYKKQMGVEWRLDSTHYTEYSIDAFTDEIEKSGLSIESTQIRFGEIYSVCTSKSIRKNGRGMND